MTSITNASLGWYSGGSIWLSATGTAHAPTDHPEEFRRDVIAVARKGEAPLRQIAKDFGMSEGCLHRWLKIADRDDGVERGTATKTGLDESIELREARERIKLLEQEAEVMRRAVAYLSRDVNPK